MKAWPSAGPVHNSSGRLQPLLPLPVLAHLHCPAPSHLPQLFGSLPPEWGEPGGFPELLELNLNENQLTGNMPDNWSVGPAFLNLADLQVRSARGLGCRSQTGEAADLLRGAWLQCGLRQLPPPTCLTGALVLRCRRWRPTASAARSLLASR